jgi:putative glutamine amidotransferase
MYPLADLFGGCFHPIRISKTGYLNEISTMSAGAVAPKVLSYHHQAAGRKGANLNTIATSADGKIVEGLQHALFKNVVGVQFHPESSSLYSAEAKFTTIPETPYSPYDLMGKSNSLTFHRFFWKDFSEKINKINHPKIP